MASQCCASLFPHGLPLPGNQGRRKFRQRASSGSREERKDFMITGSLNEEGKGSVVGAQVLTLFSSLYLNPMCITAQLCCLASLVKWRNIHFIGFLYGSNQRMKLKCLARSLVGRMLSRNDGSYCRDQGRWEGRPSCSCRNPDDFRLHFFTLYSPRGKYL